MKAIAVRCPFVLAFAIVIISHGLVRAVDQPNDNGEDFVRPPARFDFRYQFEQKADEVAQDEFIFRIDRPFRLSDGWKIATRVDVPLMLNNGSSSENPDGDYRFGTGEVLLQAVLINEFSGRWGAGIGPRMILPTASQDQFGSGKVQLGPIGGLRCLLPEISPGSFVQLVARYDCDVGGDTKRSHISRLQWSPTVNIALPRDWFVTLFPSQDIAVNFLDDGKWFFPFDFLIGKNLSRRTVTSLEISVPIFKQYDSYEFKLEARLSYFF